MLTLITKITQGVLVLSEYDRERLLRTCCAGHVCSNDFRTLEDTLKLKHFSANVVSFYSCFYLLNHSVVNTFYYVSLETDRVDHFQTPVWVLM